MLRTLCFGCSSRGQLRKYVKQPPARDSVSGLWSRSKPLDNPMMPTSVPARQSPAVGTLRPRRLFSVRELKERRFRFTHRTFRASMSAPKTAAPRVRSPAAAGRARTPRRAKFRVKPFLKGLRFPKTEPLVHPSETWRVQARSLVAALRAAKSTSYDERKTDA